MEVGVCGDIAFMAFHCSHHPCYRFHLPLVCDQHDVAHWQLVNLARMGVAPMLPDGLLGESLDGGVVLQVGSSILHPRLSGSVQDNIEYPYI
jgi:hypothetical protein